MPPRHLVLALSFLLSPLGDASAEQASYHPASIPRPGSRCTQRDKESWDKIKWGVGPFQAPTYDPCFWEHLKFLGITQKKWNEPEADRCGIARDNAVASSQACNAAQEASQVAERAAKAEPGQDPKERKTVLERALEEIGEKRGKVDAAFRPDSAQAKAAATAEKKVKGLLRGLKESQATDKGKARMKDAAEKGSLKSSLRSQQEMSRAKSSASQKAAADRAFENSRTAKREGGGAGSARTASRLKGDKTGGGQLRDSGALSVADKYAREADRTAVPELAKGKTASAAPRIDPKAPDAIDKQMRPVFLKRFEKNPIAKEFGSPMLAEPKDPKDRFVIGIQDLPGKNAEYDHKAKTLLFNRNLINDEIRDENKVRRAAGKPPIPTVIEGKLLTENQKELIADRLMPTAVHELTHTRNFRELAALSPKHVNTKETEIAAWKLQAMTIAAERKTNPGYLKGTSPAATESSDVVEVYEKQKVTRNPRAFSDYLDKWDGYKAMPSAFDPSISKNMAAGLKELKKGESECSKGFSRLRCQDLMDTMQTVLKGPAHDEFVKDRVADPAKAMDQVKTLHTALEDTQEMLPIAKTYYTGEFDRIDAADKKYIGGGP